jgi:hypothetical protein
LRGELKDSESNAKMDHFVGLFKFIWNVSTLEYSLHFLFKRNWKQMNDEKYIFVKSQLDLSPREKTIISQRIPNKCILIIFIENIFIGPSGIILANRNPLIPTMIDPPSYLEPKLNQDIFTDKFYFPPYIEQWSSKVPREEKKSFQVTFTENAIQEKPKEPKPERRDYRRPRKKSISLFSL